MNPFETKEYQELTKKRDHLESRKHMFLFVSFFFFLVTIGSLYLNDMPAATGTGACALIALVAWHFDHKKINDRLEPLEKRIQEIQVQALREKGRKS